MALPPGTARSARRARRRPYAIVLHLALVAGALPGLLSLESDNAPERFFPRGAPELAAQQRLEERFGPFDAVRLAAAGPGLWTPEGLAWLRRVEREGQGLPGARAGAGLFRRFRRAVGSWPPPDPRAFRELAAADPLSRAAGWVSADGSTAAVLLAVGEMDFADRRDLFAGLERLQELAPAGVESWVTGLPALARALDREVLDFGARYVPLVALVALLLLVGCLRSSSQAMPALALALFCEALLFGAMGYLGSPVTVATALLAPILLVLSVATGVHLQLRFRQHRRQGLEAEGAIDETWRERRWSVLASGATTLIGFGSVAVSPVPAVRAFGLWAAAGVALVTTAAFTLLPALLAATSRAAATPTGLPFETGLRRFGRWAGERSTRRRGIVLGLFALALAAALPGAMRLARESGLVGYFAPEHPVRAALEATAERGLPAATAELLIELPEESGSDPGGGLGSAAGLGRLERLAAALEADPRVRGVLGPALVTGEGPAPPSPAFLRVARALLLSEDGRSARLFVGVPMLGHPEAGELDRWLEGEAARAFPGARVTAGGRYALAVAAQATVNRTLVYALGITLVGVSAVFFALLRRGRETLRVLIPNLWPVAIVFGAMGWLSIPLGATSVMVGAIVLGLSVDDTLHFYGHYRRRGSGGEGSPRRAPVVATLEVTAGAQVLSSVMLAAGFGVCALSGFVPLAEAGALMTIGVAAALAADLFLLPALLAGKPEVRETGSPRFPPG